MYRTIDASFWTDPKVRKLSPSARYLFLYLITNPHTHVSGIYYLPWLIAQHETGYPIRVLNAAADTLSKSGVCLFDREKEVVWVVNMFNFQGHGKKNTLSAAYHLAEDIHNSFLINQFLRRYPHVEEAYKNRVSRIGDGVSEFGPPDPDPDPKQEQEQEQKGSSAELKNVGARPRDEASDFFIEICMKATGVPYQVSKGDFVSLSKLRKAFHVEARLQPPGWDQAALNYFASPHSKHSIADLCTRYSVFKNSALDEFKVPLTHRRNGHGSKQQPKESYSDRVARENRETAARFSRELSDTTGDNAGPEDRPGTSGALLPGTK